MDTVWWDILSAHEARTNQICGTIDERAPIHHEIALMQLTVELSASRHA